MSTSRRDVLLLLLLAILYTGLASIKPTHIDEAANYYYARQIAAHPLDPYGFEMFWYQEPEPANHVLTPPVLVYWWGLGMRLLGGEPVIWKLWLLPFVLLFVFSLYALLRRFARDWALPLTATTALSPAFLPSLNLMPDIPALAWSLAAVAVFLRAEESRQPSEAKNWNQPLLLAGLAGLIAGIAMQTKYTAFVTPGVLLLRAAFVGRLRLGILAGTVAAGVFAAWEALVAWKYGESHFWYQVQFAPTGLGNKLSLAGPLLPILGGVAPGTALLVLTALDVRGRFVLMGGAAVVLTVGILACTGAYWRLEVTWLGGSGVIYPVSFRLTTVLFVCLGLAVVGVSAWLAWTSWDRTADARFLVGWLALEVAGYFALTPFPAVRRVLGILVVLTLLAGRALSLRRPSARLVWSVIVGNCLLGLLFFTVDVYDAQAQMQGARRAAERIANAGGGRVWYAGHWGFQYYAEQAGMTPLVPDSSILQPGDWLVLARDPVVRPVFNVRDDRSVVVSEVILADWLPWKTVMGFYGGTEPLDHRPAARLVVEVRRVTAEWPVVSGEQ
jgi:hypothetical protein